MLQVLATLLLTAALARAGSIQYTISNDVYNECGGLYCTGGPYSLTVTFDVPSGTNVDNLSFTQGPLNTGTGGNIQPFITSFLLADGTGLQVTNSNVSGNDFFNIATDGTGNITAWYINVANPTEYAWTYWFPTYPQVYYTSGISGASGDCFQFGQSTLSATSCGGSASMESIGGSAPEPSTALLLLLGLLVYSAKTLCTNWTAIDPSPTAAATRFILPDRTSPTAKTPGKLVSSK